MDKVKEITFGTLAPAFADGMANNITLCVTEECNLRCKYCYMVGKNSSKKMSFETAQKAVDYFLSARDLYDEKSVVWDFIGGEPFLEIELIDKITDYIKDRMYLTGHPWFDDYMFSFSTNGILYDSPPVQAYIKKNQVHLSIGMSVDGNKIKHDLQRVYPDGKGSYDDVCKNVPLWLSQSRNGSTKATFSHDDLPHLKDSIVSLWDIGIKEIAANVVFEDVWEEGDPDVFESQLKELTDYVIENKIYEKPEYTVRFFDPYTGLPMSPSRNLNKFCGSGKMVSVDCDGNFFPCVRFSEFSLQKGKGYSIGNVNEGIFKDRLKPFDRLSIARVSDKECLDCDVASGCMTCTGFCYDDSESGSIYHRTKYNCEMHKANVRAIEYFWNKLSDHLEGRPNPREKARKEYQSSFNRYLVIYTDDKVVPYCCFPNNKASKDYKKMSEDTLKKAIQFANENKFTPVLVGDVFISQNKENEEYMQILSCTNGKSVPKGSIVFDNAVDVVVSSPISTLLVRKENIGNLSNLVKSLFEKCNAVRVNIILQEIEKFDQSDLDTYKSELEILATYVLNSERHVAINVLNGINKEAVNVLGCGCGKNTFTVAPNGKLYICPGFYFDDENSSVGDMDKGFLFTFGDELKVENSDDCKVCKNFQCKWCLYLNKKMTNEFSVPPHIQCQISELENKIGTKLIKDLEEKEEQLKKEVDAL